MRVTHSVRAASPVHDLPPEPAGPPAQAANDQPQELSDRQFTRLFIQGFVFGTPAVYLIVAGVSLLAAPGHSWLLLAAAWPALFAGWFFGGVVALTVHELRQERRRTRARSPGVWRARHAPAARLEGMA